MGRHRHNEVVLIFRILTPRHAYSTTLFALRLEFVGPLGEVELRVWDLGRPGIGGLIPPRRGEFA